MNFHTKNFTEIFLYLLIKLPKYQSTAGVNISVKDKYITLNYDEIRYSEIPKNV